MALRHTTQYNQYRGHKRITGPSAEPVELDQVKEQLEISGTQDDAKLNLYIQAARELAEDLTGLALITQAWRLTLDRWPSTQGREAWWDGVKQGAIGDLHASGRASELLLPRYPLQSVDALTADGDSITIGDHFISDTQQEPGRLVLKFGATFPPVVDAANAIQIDYTAGFGDTATDVPAPLRLALIQMVAHLFEHRGDGCSTEDAFKSSGAHRMFDQYRAKML